MNMESMIGGVAVWTKGSNAAAVVHPLSGPLETTEIVSARVAVKMAQSTGDVKLTVCYELSDDLESWGSVGDIDAANVVVTADGKVNGAIFVSLATALAAKRYVRFGVKAINVSGGGIIHFATAWIGFNLKKG